MTDQLLQAIEERLAERRRASLGTMTDERREKALMSLVQRARNNDGDETAKNALTSCWLCFRSLASGWPNRWHSAHRCCKPYSRRKDLGFQITHVAKLCLSGPQR
jgi:hypothetical protein